MQRKSLRCHGKWRERWRTKIVPGCCRSLAHPRKPSGNALWCLTCRSRIGAGGVWLEEVLNVDIRNIPRDDQFPLECIDHVYLSVDTTPMQMVLALSVERKGAADTRSGRDPAVMQIAAAVREARRAGSVTPWKHLRRVISLGMDVVRGSSRIGGRHGQDTQE